MKKMIATVGLIALTGTSTVIAHKKEQNGYFNAINDTDKQITISVGNFIPTEYVLPPHGSKFIMTSTDNQNVHIVAVK